MKQQPQGVSPKRIVKKNAHVAQRQRLACCQQGRFQDTLGLRRIHGVDLSGKRRLTASKCTDGGRISHRIV
jgi:hypothetical protein